MMSWMYCAGVIAAVVDSLCDKEGQIAFVLDGCRCVVPREGVESTSNFLTRRMVHSRMLGQDGEEIGLVVRAPAYLGAEEKRGPGWWREMLGRVLQSTCDGFWRRVVLGGYVRLAGGMMRRFCRHVIVSVGDAGAEGIEGGSAAMDGLYVHVVSELLAQNGELSVDYNGCEACLYFRKRDNENEHSLRRDRSRIERVLFHLGVQEEIEETLLETAWKWMRILFPSTMEAMLRTSNHRRRLYRREIEKMLELDGADMVGIEYGDECCSIEDICWKAVSARKGLGLFGARMSDKSAEQVSQCRVEVLYLGASWSEQDGILQKILRGR